ncbi:hypothetical protein [Nostoc sp.]|uniref:hypothetical protein n=1 Tax=Nostoc sp. TaxID=1180 RepID=UPI002FF9889A
MKVPLLQSSERREPALNASSFKSGDPYLSPNPDTLAFGNALSERVTLLRRYRYANGSPQGRNSRTCGYSAHTTGSNAALRLHVAPVTLL